MPNPPTKLSRWSFYRLLTMILRLSYELVITRAGPSLNKPPTQERAPSKTQLSTIFYQHYLPILSQNYLHAYAVKVI